MIKQILFILLGLFVFLFLMGALLMNIISQSETFAEYKAPPEVLATPTDNLFTGIRAVSVPGSDTITLDEQDGLAFINFWAPECRPCLSEMPTIEKLYLAHKEKVAFYIISTDGSDSRISPIIRRKGYSFPVYRLIRTPRSDSLISSLPLTLLSRGSELLVHYSGNANWNSESIHQLVEELAAEEKGAESAGRLGG